MTPQPGSTLPPCRPETGDSATERVLHPDRFYRRPGDVLTDETLTPAEQRAILSSWASDACAVDSMPSLRHAPFAPQPVTFDDIMDALMQLDDWRGGNRTPSRADPSGHLRQAGM